MLNENLWMAKVAATVLIAALASILTWQVIWAPGVGPWLNQWQTLVAGLLAIVAAIIGGYYLRWQTNDEVYRKRQASRAVLSLSLSAICDYATAAGRLGYTLWRQCGGEALPFEVVVAPDQIPALPAAIIDDLRSMIEYVERSEIPAIARLISEIQIFKGRMSDLVSPRRRFTPKSNLEEHVLDAAEIYARSEALFAFARREVEGVPQITRWQRVRAALFFMDIFEGMMPRLEETIQRRSKGDLNNIVP